MTFQIKVVQGRLIGLLPCSERLSLTSNVTLNCGKRTQAERMRCGVLSRQ